MEYVSELSTSTYYQSPIGKTQVEYVGIKNVGIGFAVIFIGVIFAELLYKFIKDLIYDL